MERRPGKTTPLGTRKQLNEGDGWDLDSEPDLQAAAEPAGATGTRPLKHLRPRWRLSFPGGGGPTRVSSHEEPGGKAADARRPVLMDIHIHAILDSELVWAASVRWSRTKRLLSGET